MKVGPLRIAMIIATSAATRTLAISRVMFSATTSSPTDREPLTSTTSAGRSSARTRSVASPAVATHVAAVVAGERADCDHLHAELAHELADLAVVGGRVVAELGHLAEHAEHAPAAPARSFRWRRAARIETGFAL